MEEHIMAKRKPNVPGQGTPKQLEFVGNTPTEKTFDILYTRYVKAYDAAKGKLRAGENMYLLRRNKTEFKAYYMAVANETPVSDTPAATANQIITNMVEESRYLYNNKQAKAYKKGLANIGIIASMIDLREGKYEKEIHGQLENAIDARGKELREQGKSGYEIRRIIGQEFFDSPV